jgi:hypothetical protein
VLAEVAEQEAGQEAADLAVARDLAAIELSQDQAEWEAARLADAARERDRQAAARAMARRYAAAATQAGDFELAASTLIELSSGQESSAIELAATDVSAEFGACGTLGPETLISPAGITPTGACTTGPPKPTRPACFPADRTRSSIRRTCPLAAW